MNDRELIEKAKQELTEKGGFEESFLQELLSQVDEDGNLREPIKVSYDGGKYNPYIGDFFAVYLQAGALLKPVYDENKEVIYYSTTVLRSR